MSSALGQDASPFELYSREGKGWLARCFQCGACAGWCPSGRFTALNTRRIMRQVQVGEAGEGPELRELWYCTTCNSCVDHCPARIRIVEVIFGLRNLAVKEGHMAPAHRRTARSLLRTGHMVQATEKNRQARDRLGLDGVPPTVLADGEGLAGLQSLCHLLAFDVLIGGPRAGSEGKREDERVEPDDETKEGRVER